MIKFSEIVEIVNAISYKPNWVFEVHGAPDRNPPHVRPYLQATVTDTPDSQTGELTLWKSAKHYLSYHMCRQEIVGTVFRLIRDAEEHEMREWFRYRGRGIYNPHIDPDALVDALRLYGHSAFVMRENAMTMEENDG